jgi:hypothetical protein
VDDDDRSSIVRSLSGLALLGLVSGESSGRGLGAVVSLILGSLGGGRAEEAFAVGFLCLFWPTGGGGGSIFLPFERGMVETCE